MPLSGPVRPPTRATRLRNHLGYQTLQRLGGRLWGRRRRLWCLRLIGRGRDLPHAGEAAHEKPLRRGKTVMNRR